MAKTPVARKKAPRRPLRVAPRPSTAGGRAVVKKPDAPEFLNGNEACVEGAIAAGCRFFAGAPLSPAQEILQRFLKRMPEAGGVAVHMENAPGALSACLGASWAGRKALTATSGPGLSAMLDDVGFAIMTETPVVIVDIQRAGPSQGQGTRPAQGDVQQVRWGASGDYEIIALAPWSVQEMYELTIEAFNLSEQFRVPVFLLADESVGHLREFFHLKKLPPPIERNARAGQPIFGGKEDEVPPMPPLGQGGKMLVTGSTHNEDGLYQDLCPEAQANLVARLSQKILAQSEKISRTEPLFLEGAEVVVISYGIAARAAAPVVKAARTAGQKVGFLRLISLWPFPDGAVRRACENAKHVIVAELNRGQVAREVERALGRDVIRLTKTNGELILPAEVSEVLKKAVAE